MSGSSTYVMKMEVDGQSAVDAAASSVDKLDTSLNGILDSASSVTGAMDSASGGAQDLADNVTGAGDASMDAVVSLSTLENGAKDLEKKLDKLGDAAKKTKTNFGELEGAFGKLGGPIGRLGRYGSKLGDTFQKLRKTFSLGTVAAIGIAAGVAAVAVAAVAATVAVVALGAGLVAFALGVNEAKRLGEITKKLKKDIRDLFAGPKTKDAANKFVDSLGRITEMFSQNSIEGRGLQKILDTITAPLINGLTKLEPYAKAVFRGLIVGALDIAILAVRIGKALEKMIPEGVIDDVNALEIAFDIGRYAMYAFAVVLAVVAVVLLVVVAALVLLGVMAAVSLGMFVAISLFLWAVVAAVVAGIIAALYGLYHVVKDVGKWIADGVSEGITALANFATAGANAAKNMIAGLVGGIKAGVGPVVDAIKALASSAIAAMKSALKIASPSKLFEGLGGLTGEGYAIGVENETPHVQSSLESMVTPPKTPMLMQSTTTETESGAASKGSSISIQGNTFVFNGVPGAENARQMFEETLLSIFEGDAIALGAMGAA